MLTQHKSGGKKWQLFDWQALEWQICDNVGGSVDLFRISQYEDLVGKKQPLVLQLALVKQFTCRL